MLARISQQLTPLLELMVVLPSQPNKKMKRRIRLMECSGEKLRKLGHAVYWKIQILLIRIRIRARDYPKPRLHFIPDTKGIQWADTDATL